MREFSHSVLGGEESGIFEEGPVDGDAGFSFCPALGLIFRRLHRGRTIMAWHGMAWFHKFFLMI